MTLESIVSFQAIMNQIARERRASRHTLETIARMREWHFQILLYSELHRRYWVALHDHDILTAERIWDVLTLNQPRYKA
ncbi:MAG TPA: hypothetical protein VLK33_23025 [Terriglobales bacterium]|nr:hypothetical protein [Terriglobales bacterium]